MSRGNRQLGVVELVEEMESLTPLLERLVMADGQITPSEQHLLDSHRFLGAGGQALALRTQIGLSLMRGLSEPPVRTAELIDQHCERYGPLLMAAD